MHPAGPFARPTKRALAPGHRPRDRRHLLLHRARLKLRETDFAPPLPGVWLDKPVTIIVPIIVLDELDGLKQRGGTAHVKWRASYTLAVFDDIFTKAGVQAILQQPAADGTRGPVLMDILYDPPRHERLPVNDDEIIDRALTAQSTAGSPVTLLTYDTSQAPGHATPGWPSTNSPSRSVVDQKTLARSGRPRQARQPRQRPGDNRRVYHRRRPDQADRSPTVAPWTARGCSRS